MIKSDKNVHKSANESKKMTKKKYYCELTRHIRKNYNNITIAKGKTWVS